MGFSYRTAAKGVRATQRGQDRSSSGIKPDRGLNECPSLPHSDMPSRVWHPAGGTARESPAAATSAGEAIHRAAVASRRYSFRPFSFRQIRFRGNTVFGLDRLVFYFSLHAGYRDMGFLIRMRKRSFFNFNRFACDENLSLASVRLFRVDLILHGRSDLAAVKPEQDASPTARSVSAPPRWSGSMPTECLLRSDSRAFLRRGSVPEASLRLTE